MHGTWKTEGGGLGGAGLIALVVVLAIAAAVLHAIWRTIVEAAEIAAVTVIAVIAAAVLAGAGYAALRIRRRVLEQRARRPVPVRAEVVQLGAEVVRAADRQPALEAPHAASWPLPGWWDEIRPRIGHDDEGR